MLPNEANPIESVSCTDSQYVAILAGMPSIESRGAVKKLTGLGKQEGERVFIKKHVVENVPNLGKVGETGILLVDEERK